MPMEDWVAPTPDLFTAVVHPVFIERKLFEPLSIYHPRPVDVTPMLFRLDAATDEGGEYAKFVTTGGKWDDAWVKMLDALRMRLDHDSAGREFLIDKAPNVAPLGSTDLVPSQWRIEKTFDFKNQPILQEIIDWRNTVTGDTGISIYSWIPY